MTAARRAGDDKRPSTEFVLPPVVDEQARARAVRCVATHARDAADAALLLDVLGLSATEAAAS